MKNNSTNQGFVIGITLVATLGGLLFGYDTAVISGAVGSIQAFFIDVLKQDTTMARSVVVEYRIMVSLVTLTIIVAMGTILTKLYKRKTGMTITVVLVLIASFVLYYFFGGEPVLDEHTANSIKGFTISSALVGCIIGGSIGGFVSRKFGRKNGLTLAAILFFISAIGSAVPEMMNIYGVEHIISFIIYRILGGIGVGLASMLAPMYIAEIAPAKMRGNLVSWNQFAIIFGMNVIYVVNFVIARQGDVTWLNEIGWRWMFASETIPAVLFMVLLFFVPETPRYLVMEGKDERALGVLKKLGGEGSPSSILEQIKETLKVKDAPWLSYGGKLIIVGILLSVFQQFVGINVVLYYAPEIFKSMGNNPDDSLLLTIIVGAVLLTFTVLAIFTVDKYGRKPLQVIGAIGMAFSMICLGFILYMESLGLGALIFMLLYIAFFAMSWGPIVWVLIAEIFPNKIRGAMSIAVAAQWLANLIISWTFPIMNDNTWLTGVFHHGFAYWIYGIMGILAAIFMWKMVPETKGRTLEDMEQLWTAKG